MEIRPVFRYDVNTRDLAKWRTSNFKQIAHFSKWSEFPLGVFAIKSIIVLYLAAQTVLTERKTRVLLEYLQLSWDRTLKIELWQSSIEHRAKWLYRIGEEDLGADLVNFTEFAGTSSCTVYNDDWFWRFLSLFPHSLILSTSVLCSRFKACVFIFR